MEQTPPSKDIAMELIAALKADDNKVRQEAAERLGELGDPRAVQPLIDLLREQIKTMIEDDEGEDAWLTAWDSLVKIGEPSVLPLLGLIADKDNINDIRFEAVEALAEIGDERAVEPFLKVLLDRDDHEMHSSVAYALSDFDDERAIEPLIQALKCQSSDVQDVTDRLAKVTRDPQALELLVGNPNNRDEFVRAHAEDIRSAAAEALANFRDPHVVEALIESLHDESASVRQIAAESLGKIVDTRAIPALILMQQGETDRLHANRDAKASAQKAIDAIKARQDGSSETHWYTADLPPVSYGRAAEPFITNLNDKNTDVRRGAAIALGELGDWRGVDPLLNLLGDGDNDLRYYAIEALGKLGEERALTALIWLKHKDEGETSSGAKIKDAATKAIERIREQNEI